MRSAAASQILADRYGYSRAGISNAIKARDCISCALTKSTIDRVKCVVSSTELQYLCNAITFAIARAFLISTTANQILPSTINHLQYGRLRIVVNHAIQIQNQFLTFFHLMKKYYNWLPK